MKIKNNKRRKGFTLIELIVVIAILAILAAVAIPNFIGLTKKATNATEVAAASEIANAVNVNNAMAEGGTATAINALPATEVAFKAALGDLYPSFDATYANVVARLQWTVVSGTKTICSVDPTKKGDLT